MIYLLIAEASSSMNVYDSGFLYSSRLGEDVLVDHHLKRQEMVYFVMS